MQGNWQYAVVEWIWDGDSIRVNLPGKPEMMYRGSYAEVVDLLTSLGREGWEVVTCSGAANWLLWTLKK